MAKQIFSTGADTYEIEVSEEKQMAEPAVAQPIELKLKTGEVIKAPSYEEALKIAVGMAENTKDAFHEEKTKREQLEARVQAMEARAQEAARPKPVDGQFDQNKYYEILNRDPVEAANYVDAFRFGISDPKQVPAVFQQLQADVSVTRQEAMAAQFVQQHAKDFPQTAEAAKELRVQFEAYLAQGYPATLDTLNLAYGQSVNTGKIKPLEEKEEPEEIEPNPSLTGGGGATITDQEAAKVEQMSDRELEAYLKSKGLL